MRIIAVANAKGGVGKSTTTINLAAALAGLDQRVLVIDADPSANSTLGFFPTGAPDAGLADMLLDGLSASEIIQPSGVDGLDVIPPGIRLGLCSDQMGGSQGLGQGREFRVRRVLRAIEHYDIVLIDTSPVSTPLNVAILYAVNEILIPIDPCVAALAGVKVLEALIHDVSIFRQELSDAGPLRVAGVLITRCDRTLVSKQVEAEVRSYFGDKVFGRSVPTSVKFREAYARGIPLVVYDRLSPGALAYKEAAEAILGLRDRSAAPEDGDADVRRSA